jgi:hypothetical protein
MDTMDFAVIEQMVHAMTPGNPWAAQRAVRALGQLLDGVHRSRWPEVAWCFSHLTSTGFPVEFAWSSSDTALRYTCEIAGPEADPAERLDQARHLLERLSHHSLPDELFHDLRGLQEQSTLYYGAWVGGRHTAQGDDFKLYAEVPIHHSGQVGDYLQPFLGDRARLPNRPVRLRMIGYTLGDARPEFYFRVGELEVWELELLLDRCGLSHRQADFLTFLETVYGCPMRERLPGSNYGFSVAQSLNGKASTFSLLTFASCVFGRDEATHRSVLQLAAKQGWHFYHYAAMSAPPHKCAGCIVRHGMVAFVVSQTKMPALQIGFAPPN